MGCVIILFPVGVCVFPEAARKDGPGRIVIEEAIHVEQKASFVINMQFVRGVRITQKGG